MKQASCGFSCGNEGGSTRPGEQSRSWLQQQRGPRRRESFGRQSKKTGTSLAQPRESMGEKRAAGRGSAGSNGEGSHSWQGGSGASGTAVAGSTRWVAC